MTRESRKEATDPNDSASFLASFPAIQSAIKVDGAGNGMRIQLDVPESEMAEALKLLMWRQEVLWVTIGPERTEDDRKRTGLHF